MIKEAVRADVVRVRAEEKEARREGKDRKSHVGKEEAPGCLPRDGTAHSGRGSYTNWHSRHTQRPWKSLRFPLPRCVKLKQIMRKGRKKSGVGGGGQEGGRGGEG